MNVRFLNPFIDAIFYVLNAELGLKAERGELQLQRANCTTQEVTVLISLVGDVQGVVLYGLDQTTSLNIVGAILGQPFEEFDELAQSGVGELGNMITGQASKKLAEAGYQTNISPPTLITGENVEVSTLDFQRLVVPVTTELGSITIHLALRDQPHAVSTPAVQADALTPTNGSLPH